MARLLGRLLVVGCALTATVIVGVRPAAAATIYFENFESGLNGFVLDNHLSGLWHLTGNVPFSGTTALGYVKEETPGGALDGNYNTGTRNAGTAFSPGIALPLGTLSLSFHSINVTEGGTPFDSLDLLVNTSQSLAGATLLGPIPTSNTYALRTFDLSAFAGQTIFLAFDFDTVDAISNSTAGIRIDDIAIASVPEPASLALLTSGLAAAVIRRRRR